MANAISHNAWLKLHPRNMTRGAPMGQSDDNLDPDVKVHIEKLRWEDGDYTLDGTYWGRSKGDFIWAVWQDIDGERRCLHIREHSRVEVVLYVITKLGLDPLRK